MIKLSNKIGRQIFVTLARYDRIDLVENHKVKISLTLCFSNRMHLWTSRWIRACFSCGSCRLVVVWRGGSVEVGTQDRKQSAERHSIITCTSSSRNNVRARSCQDTATYKSWTLPVNVQFVSIGCFSLSLVLAMPTVTSLFLPFFNIYSHVLDFREMRNEHQDHGEYAKQDEAGKEQAHRYSDPSFCPHGCEI